MSFRRPLTGLGLLVIVLVAWWGVAAGHFASTLIVPTPASTLRALSTLLDSPGDLLSTIRATFVAVGLSFLLAAATGVVLGLVVGRSALFSAAYEPMFAALNTIPFIILYPMLVGALGVSLTPKLVVGFLAALLPIMLASISAARTVDQTLLVALRSVGASPMKRFSSVVVPATLPQVFTGLRTGLGLCSITVIAGEYIASLDGLGYRLAETSESLQTPELYAYLIVTLVFAGVLNALLAASQSLVNKGVHK